MYFLHKQATQEQIDSIINKSCAMQRIITKRPKYIKGIGREREREFEDEIFSDLHGYRSFSGMEKRPSNMSELP